MNRGAGLARSGLGGHLFNNAARRQQPRGQRGQQRSARAATGGGSSSSGGPRAPPASQASTAAGSGGGSRFGWAKWALLPSAAAALLGGVSHALATTQQAELEAGHARAERSLKAAEHWIADIAQQPGVVKAFDAAMLMEADHAILEVGAAACPPPCIGRATF